MQSTVNSVTVHSWPGPQNRGKTARFRTPHFLSDRGSRTVNIARALRELQDRWKTREHGPLQFARQHWTKQCFLRDCTRVNKSQFAQYILRLNTIQIWWKTAYKPAKTCTVTVSRGQSAVCCTIPTSCLCHVTKDWRHYAGGITLDFKMAAVSDACVATTSTNLTVGGQMDSCAVQNQG